MGKLVEVTQMRYYGNARRRPGEQFIMADSDFERQVMKTVKGEDGKDKLVPDGDKKEEVMPMGVIVIEDGYEDPIVVREADKKKDLKPQKRAVKKQEPDEHVQGGRFDVHPETGVQVTGQVAPARPASSSVHESTIVPDAKPAKGDAKKSSGDKSVL